MLVDTGSSVDPLDILFLDAYLKLGISRAQIRPVATSLVGFTGDAVSPLGVSNLMVTMGKYSQHASRMVEFPIVDMADGAYHGSIGRPTLSQFEAIVSPIHLKMKFHTRHGTGEIQGIQEKARKCYLASTKQIKAQMEVGSTSRGTEGLRDCNVYTLAVVDEKMETGRPREEIRSILFKWRGPKRDPTLGT
ncbi:hypothetical protein LIER_17077 [Lithospermum erythrorhizon]|uniref:Peptidase A2 domain-containing protein n=1 Tax=Lithospermum erythrorhizon TaxID=34254 RepID=A0AAV3QBD6_LITER